jgi:hypothetical protein
MTTSKRKVIIPMRNRCDCGKKVLNHHWLCDHCWGKKARAKNRKKQSKQKKYVHGQGVLVHSLSIGKK